MNFSKCIIILPTYNDWESIIKLLKVTNNSIKKSKFRFEVLIINDASTKKGQINISELKNFTNSRIRCL